MTLHHNSASGHPAPLSHSPQTCSGIGAFYPDRTPASVASAVATSPNPARQTRPIPRDEPETNEPGALNAGLAKRQPFESEPRT